MATAVYRRTPVHHTLENGSSTSATEFSTMSPSGATSPVPSPAQFPVSSMTSPSTTAAVPPPMPNSTPPTLPPTPPPIKKVMTLPMPVVNQSIQLEENDDESRNQNTFKAPHAQTQTLQRKNEEVNQAIKSKNVQPKLNVYYQLQCGNMTYDVGKIKMDGTQDIIDFKEAVIAANSHVAGVQKCNIVHLQVFAPKRFKKNMDAIPARTKIADVFTQYGDGDYIVIAGSPNHSAPLLKKDRLQIPNALTLLPQRLSIFYELRCGGRNFEVDRVKLEATHNIIDFKEAILAACNYVPELKRCNSVHLQIFPPNSRPSIVIQARNKISDVVAQYGDGDFIVVATPPPLAISSTYSFKSRWNDTYLARQRAMTKMKEISTEASKIFFGIILPWLSSFLDGVLSYLVDIFADHNRRLSYNLGIFLLVCGVAILVKLFWMVLAG